MEDLKIWILTAVAVILGGVLTFFGKAAFNGITDLLKSMLVELQKITGINIQHEERIKNLEESRKDHEERIRELTKKA